MRLYIFVFQYWETSPIANFVRAASAWDEPNTEDAMAVLCRRAGQELRDMPEGDEKQNLLDEIRRLAPEFLEDTPDVSAEVPDLIDFIQDPEQASWGDIAFVIQDILGVDLGM